MKEKNSNSTQSITRLFTVIETMASIGRPVRLQEIAEQSNASPSTVMRILNAMIENGYATQNPETQFYSLSYKFMQIGNAIRENISLNTLLHPYLYEISLRTGLSSAVSVRSGSKVTFIDEEVVTTNIVRVHHHLGVPFPLYSTATGKLFLSRMTPAELNQYFLNENMSVNTQKTLSNRRLLEEDFRKIRKQGYAFNDEESVLGMRCLAFPVLAGEDDLLAVISVSGTTFQITDDNLDKIVSTVKGILDDLHEKCMPALQSIYRDNSFQL